MIYMNLVTLQALPASLLRLFAYRSQRRGTALLTIDTPLESRTT